MTSSRLLSLHWKKKKPKLFEEIADSGNGQEKIKDNLGTQENLK